jgi:hypothetical protein
MSSQRPGEQQPLVDVAPIELAGLIGLEIAGELQTPALGLAISG